MTREEKTKTIENLTERINSSDFFYLTDIADIDAATTSKLRAICFKRNVGLLVVKNKLLKKAMERSDKELQELSETLVGPTAIMFAEAGNAPAKLIKEFRKNFDKPVIKGAYVEEVTFIGDDKLEQLANIKSREELIGDIVTLLQSPAKNVISALQSGGSILHGVLKTLGEKK